MTKQYKPIRDRGVYRADANSKSPNHKWASKLVKGLGTVPGLLAWIYRDKGRKSIMAELVYADNPLLKLIKKEEGWSSKYQPVPLKRFE